MILHVEGGNPVVPLLKLKSAGGAVEVEPEDEGEHERGKAEGERGPTYEILVPLAKREDNERAGDGQGGEDGDDGEGGHAFAPQSRKMTSAMSATPITLR